MIGFLTVFKVGDLRGSLIVFIFFRKLFFSNYSLFELLLRHHLQWSTNLSNKRPSALVKMALRETNFCMNLASPFFSLPYLLTHKLTDLFFRHLIGFFLFLGLTIYTATKVPNVVGSIQLNCLPPLPSMPDFNKLRGSIPSFDSVLEHLSNCIPDPNLPSNQTNDQYGWDMEEVMIAIAPALHPITRWPFYAFLGGAMFCLLASSACHLLSCHSERLSYIMLRVDYAGIAALITTSFYPPVYYSFMCNHFLRNLYLTFITVFGIITIIFSLFPCFQSPGFRSIRASLFFGMGVSGAAPIFHKLILYWDQPEAVQTTGYELLMGALYGFGALIYATRIPERWMPGKVDLAGHSHQIFHVLVVAGAYTHYLSGLIYLKWRDLHGCNKPT